MRGGVRGNVKLKSVHGAKGGGKLAGKWSIIPPDLTPAQQTAFLTQYLGAAANSEARKYRQMSSVMAFTLHHRHWSPRCGQPSIIIRPQDTLILVGGQDSGRVVL